MYLKRAEQLKKYILQMYPKIHKDKIDVLKVGNRIYLILVTPDNKLVREKLFEGILETVNSLSPMKRILDTKILKIMLKYGYK